MNTYTIYTDLHIGNKYGEMNILPNNPIIIEQQNAIALGDIYDVKNCEKNNLENILKKCEAFSALYKDRMVSGNHDPKTGPLELIKDGHILFVHGDLVLWDMAKVNAFRAEVPGQGCGLIQRIAAARNGKLGKKDKKLLSDYAKMRKVNCICIGHVHPSKLIDENVDGIRVICFPKGKTVIAL